MYLKRGVRWACFAAICLSFVASASTVRAAGGELGLDPGAPVALLDQDFQTTGACRMHQWVVLGPMPCPSDQVEQTGRDWLAPLGGEAQATLRVGQTLTLPADVATTPTAPARLAALDRFGVLDLLAIHNNERKEQACSYAFTYVKSARAQKVHGFFGANDAARLYVNGVLIKPEKLPMPRHASTPPNLDFSDHFTAELREGLNPVLVKVAQKDGPWAMALELTPEDKAQTILAELGRKHIIREFQDVEIGPKEKYGFNFVPGPLPELTWVNEKAVAAAFGQVPALKVRWFDGALNEVAKAERPGRYAAYIEAETADGRKIRRSLVFFCRDPEWHPWTSRLAPSVPYVEGPQINASVWAEQQTFIDQAAGSALMESMGRNAAGAAFFAGLAEAKPTGHPATQLEAPWNTNLEYQLKLKRKILGLPEQPAAALKAPRPKPGTPATVLHKGKAVEAGMKRDARKRIHNACQAWFDATHEPFAVLVARHGVVVIHEAFGEMDGKPVTLETRFTLASITKPFAAMLFLQFVDQGLIQLEDPVGQYLPDFPTADGRALTLRQCLNHTTGLEGHGEWGGLDNPWLDNVIANGPEWFQPGRTVCYNGMGFDLAGRVMEQVSGKSIFRLMHEQMFQPLGFRADTTVADLAYGIDCTVENLARFGQTLLNRGAYGNVELIRPETFERMMPRQVGERYPALKKADWDYGLGLSWMRHGHPDAGKKGLPADAMILSPRTIGHGSASSCILEVDLEHDLVVTMTRNFGQKDIGRHLPNFLLSVRESLAEEK